MIILDWIYLQFPFSFQLLLESHTQPPPSFVFYLISYWVQLLLPVCTWVWANTWAWGNSLEHTQPAMDHATEENWHLSFSSYHLLKVPWLQVGLHELPVPWCANRLDFAGLSVGSHSCCEFMSAETLSFSRRHMLQGSSPASGIYGLIDFTFSLYLILCRLLC